MEKHKLTQELAQRSDIAAEAYAGARGMVRYLLSHVGVTHVDTDVDAGDLGKFTVRVLKQGYEIQEKASAPCECGPTNPVDIGTRAHQLKRLMEKAAKKKGFLLQDIPVDIHLKTLGLLDRNQ